MAADLTAPSFAETTRVWFKIGCLGFGGPAGQIALLHREVVEQRRWIEEDRFQHALSFCMLLPGPEAQQLATYIGWLLHGVRGGLAAGLLFVAPGLALLIGLSALYVAYGSAPEAQAVLLGLKAAVVALVLEALLRIGRRSLKSAPAVATAVITLAAMLLVDAPFPLVVLVSGLAGAALGRGPVAADDQERPPAVSAAASVRTVLVWSLVWLAPVALVFLILGGDATIARMGLFFSQAALVTFGGAYAVLAYVAQAAVESFGWLSAPQMLDGLGLAETTPGPLILVLVFVAFVGAFQTAPEGWAWASALAAALLTAWVTFAPSFLWIFAGAPYVERLRRARRLTGALALVGAAVTGVIAHLALWFALHLLFSRTAVFDAGPLHLEVPVLATVSWPALVLVLVGGMLVFVLHRGVFTVLGVCLGAALVMQLAGWL